MNDADLKNKHCIPCEGGTLPLTKNIADTLHTQIPAWEINEDTTRIRRSFNFDDFAEALDFVNKVGTLADSEGHHPDIELSWGHVEIMLWTHAINGLSENDFILASKIDNLV